MFNDFNKEIVILNKKTDIDMSKLNATLDCSMFESALELENLEFMILTESYDDVESYIKEAKDSRDNKVSNIIQSTIALIEKFFFDLIDKVKTLFVKKEIEDSIDRLKIKIKKPEISTLKIEIPDFNAEARTINDYKNNLKKIFAEVNMLSLKVSNVKSNSELKELNKDWDDIKDKLSDEKEIFLKKHNAISNNTVTVSAETAVSILTHSYNSNVMDVALSKMKNSNIKDISGINNIDTMDIKIMKKCLNMQFEISKIEGNLLVNSLTRLITAIFKGIDDYNDED